MPTATISIVLLLTALPLAGCGLTEQVETLRAHTETLGTQLDAEIDHLAAQRALLPQGDPALQDLDDAIAARAQQRDAVDAALARLDTTAADLENPGGILTEGVGLALPFLPEPFRGPAVALAGIAAAVWRASRLKKAAGSIAEGLDKAMRRDADLRAAVQRNADLFRTVQTPTARRIVDEATKDRPMLRLPV